MNNPITISERPLARVLFVDDEERILKTLKAIFRRKYEVLTTTDGYVALEYMKQNHIHVVVSDQRMPGVTGVEFLRQAKVVSPRTLRILLTGYSDLAAIVGSINEGEVFRFINKPWGNEEIERLMGEAVDIALRLGAGEESVEVEPVNVIPEMEESVLVVSPFRPLAEEMQKILKGRCPMLRARYLREVLHILNISPVGVVVAEAHPEHEDVTLFLKLLKQRFPEIVTVFVTPTADAELAISLINQAQIFRFLSAPISAEALHRAIGDAVRHYRTITRQPERLEMHRVEEVPESARGVAQWLLDGLRALPGRFGFRRT